MRIFVHAKKRSLTSLLNVCGIKNKFSIEKLGNCEYIVTVDDTKKTGELLHLLRNTDLQYKEIK